MFALFNCGQYCANKVLATPPPRKEIITVFDVTIYKKNGRAMYDHVVQITNMGGDFVTLDFITDLHDHIEKRIPVEEIVEMKVKIYE